MSGKIYFHEFAPAGVTMHNRYRAWFDFEMFRQRSNDSVIGPAIFCRLADFDNQRAVSARRNAGFLRAWNDFYRESHATQA